MILRDRETKAKWHEEATEDREERLYYCQNWRADVSAILTDAGSMVEWVKYSVYGVPFALPAGDTDSDGDWDATDSAKIAGWSAGYDVRADTNLDGVINGADITHANSIVGGAGGYQTLGRGLLSSPGVNNRRGYAGYEYDPTLEGAGRWLYHVRHRVYDAEVGRWTRRDPLGYVDGMSLYQYVRGMAVVGRDPRGLDMADSGCTRPGWCLFPDEPPVGFGCVFISKSLDECLQCCIYDPGNGQVSIAECAEACFNVRDWDFPNRFAPTNPVRRSPRHPLDLPGAPFDPAPWTLDYSCNEFVGNLMYGDFGDLVDGNDKFQHCYTSCRLQQICGRSIAKFLGDIREVVVPGPDSDDDLLANEQGLFCAALVCPSAPYREPRAACCNNCCSRTYPPAGPRQIY